MTVAELIAQLQQFSDQGAEVHLEVNINGSEFICKASKVYESGSAHIFGKGDFYDVQISYYDERNW